MTTMFQSAPPTEVRGDVIDTLITRFMFVFQSAPPTEVRGDPGSYNQQSDSKLRISMRDSLDCTTKKLVSFVEDHRNPLLCIEFFSPRNQRWNPVTLSSRNL